MKGKMPRTRRGAASIYIVIFTTTLLGVIALSFVRIMLAEALRTTNYNLSQSAYNSALAGVEDAKIALLRYQNCVNDPGYLNDCYKYTKAFDTQSASDETAQNCDIVRELLGYIGSEDNETIIQTDNARNGGQNTKKGSAEAFDQAYTCVKITSHTNDFIATLNNSNPTKLVPLRASTDALQKSINRVELEWFSLDDYRTIANGSNLNEKWYDALNSSNPQGTLVNNAPYEKTNDRYKNNFIDINTKDGMAPPTIQATFMQTNSTFTLDEFYARNGNNTNRGTLMLRPSSATGARTVLPTGSLAYSANKSFNTPIDVKCENLLSSSSPSNYSCRASVTLPAPYRGLSEGRNRSTSFVLLNLPYNVPSTEVRIKMYTCHDVNAATDSEYEDNGTMKKNCQTIKFAGVQPIVDSTGRANDLFRRVEARIELVDTYFPLSNYALAMTDPTNDKGISKSFYVTNTCRYSSSSWDSSKGDVVDVTGTTLNYGTGSPLQTCADVANTASGNGKGNGE
ncbi:hypothetical protein IK110_00800 [Candidatus Saccharibacteria bacterium]|nr:hypothetical protein [Candidatus Saccharibacteria bacterium]